MWPSLEHWEQVGSLLRHLFLGHPMRWLFKQRLSVGTRRSSGPICHQVILTTGGSFGLSKISIRSPFFIVFERTTMINFWSASVYVSSSFVESDKALLATVPQHWFRALCSVTWTSIRLCFFICVPFSLVCRLYFYYECVVVSLHYISWRSDVCVNVSIERNWAYIVFNILSWEIYRLIL